MHLQICIFRPQGVLKSKKFQKKPTLKLNFTLKNMWASSSKQFLKSHWALLYSVKTSSSSWWFLSGISLIRPRSTWHWGRHCAEAAVTEVVVVVVGKGPSSWSSQSLSQCHRQSRHVNVFCFLLFWKVFKGWFYISFGLEDINMNQANVSLSSVSQTIASRHLFFC